MTPKSYSEINWPLKAGSRIRTYKPVVYKPSENAIVASDKNNDRKFMFLSEETQPDYRPIDVRKKEKPCPRIDHRPLGADSYSKVSSYILKASLFWIRAEFFTTHRYFSKKFF